MPDPDTHASHKTAYIGLGANLPSKAGLPLDTLLAARRRLLSVGDVVASSSLYATEPVGVTDQPEFLNAVVALRTALDPHALLSRLHALERSFGRDRAQERRLGPRTLDLDLLLVGSLKVADRRLRLPHPELHRRRFVLAPLVEIAPALLHPVLGKTMYELLRALPETGTAGAARAVRLPSAPLWSA